MYCNLIVTRPFNQVFTYDTGNTKVKKGQIAIVPFGKSIEVGMIVEINVSKSDYKIKKVHKILSSIYFHDETINFIYWISNYTLAPIGSVLKLFIINQKIVQYKHPPITKRKITSNSVDLNMV